MPHTVTSATPPNAPQRASGPKPRIVAAASPWSRTISRRVGASAGEDAFARPRARRVRLPRANRGRVQRRSFGGGVERGRRRRGGRGSLGGGERVGGRGADANASAGRDANEARMRTRRRGPRRRFGRHPVRRLGRWNTRGGILRRVLLDPTLQGGASEAVPAGELDVVSGLRSRRWAPTRGESGKEFRASLFGVAFDLANHAGLFLGGESVIEVAGGFRGGGPRGTLHRGSLGVAVVVVVARFRVHLRVDEFLEGRSSSSSTWEGPARGSARERYGPSPRADRDPCSP